MQRKGISFVINEFLNQLIVHCFIPQDPWVNQARHTHIIKSEPPTEIEKAHNDQHY